MKMKKFVYLPAALLMASCGGAETTETTESDKDSVVTEIQYGPLKSREEMSTEPVYKNIADVDGAADKSTIIRFVSEEYYKPFPVSILDAHNLQILSLTNMTDAELPADISKLKNLTTLDLTNASITQLPESIGEMENLMVVSLAGCKSLDVNQALGVLKNCPNIKYLNLSSMDLAEAPAGLGDFAALEHLRIGYNQLTVFPDSFYALQNISEIHLAGPASFDQDDFFTKAKAFPKLTTLSLQYCGLTGLPAILNEYPALATVRWREEWADKDGDQIIATTEKENKKFPKLHVTWSEMSANFYDIY